MPASRLLVGGWMFLASLLPLAAQGSLTNGGSNPGSIFPSGDVDAWTTSAVAGDRLYFKAAEIGADTDFWPRIEMFDPDGLLVAASNGGIAATLERTATKTGTYTILLRDDSGSTHVSTGDYRLNFLKVPGGFIVPGGDAGGALTSGANQPGAIYQGDVDAWTATAAVGDRLYFKIAESGTDTVFWPRIELIDPDGVLVAAATGGTAATIERTATKAGTYTLVVRDDSGSAGSSGGNYQLHFLKIPGGFVVPAGDQGGALTSGGNHPGVIHVGDYDAWTATVAAGDRLYFKIAETAGDTAFWPRVELIDPDGVLVAATIERNATKSGTYTLVVRDDSGSAGSSTGNYLAHFLRIPGGFEIPAGDEGGALTNGAEHLGTIHVGDVDAWTTTASIGDRLNFKIAETAGDTAFWPRIELIDPDGTLVAAASSSVAVQIERNATKAGTYTLVVRDDSGSAGSSSGDYRLNFLKVPGGFVVPAGDEGGTLISGANHYASIHVGDLDPWTIGAISGNRLYFKIVETGTDTVFWPRIDLLDPDGAFVTGASSGASTFIDRTVAKTGTFTVVVRDDSGSTGPSAGAYRLYAANLSNPYFAWIYAAFGTAFGDPGSEATLWGANADSDGDGMPNLAEYYLGRNPAVRETGAALALSLTQEALACDFRRKAGALAATGVVEWTTDLTTWQSTGVVYDAPIPDGAFEIVRAYVPLPPGGRMFVRLNVTASP